MIIRKELLLRIQLYSLTWLITVFTTNLSAQQIILRSGIFTPTESKNLLGNDHNQSGNSDILYGLGISSNSNIVPNSGMGLKVIKYAGNNQYYVSLSSGSGVENVRQQGFSHIYPIERAWKVDPLLMDFLDSLKDPEATITLNCFSLSEISAPGFLNADLPSFVSVVEANHLTNSVLLKFSQRYLDSILDHDQFFWFELPPPPVEINNLVERTNHRVPHIEKEHGVYGLSGKNVVVGEWDGSGAQNHIDYAYHHIQVEPFTNNNNGRHATHVAGTVLGAGVIDPLATGMAPDAELVSYNFSGNIPVEMDTAASKYGIELTQNSYSYGSTYDRCSIRGTYDATSVALDELTNKYDYLLHVFAAGNSRFSNCLSGGYGTVHSGFQASKNSIAVGALTRTDGNSSFHCYGPVKDGRLKPEICGVGVNVYSTFPINSYRGGYNGTSMACPGVSGTAALIHQLYQDSTGKQIPAHLLKGTLCNGADDIGRAGLDYQFGFGRINGKRTADIIAKKQYVIDSVSNGGVFTDTIFTSTGLNELQVILCWTDDPASPSASTMLVNDLDLELQDSAGNIIMPWVLNPSSYTSTAKRGRDSINPIEQVTLKPQSPYYVVRVKGKRVVSGRQSFSLNWLLQDSSITVIYPNGGEHWVAPASAGSEQIIRWDSYGLNGTTRVEFSSDSGKTWATLASTVPANRRYYSWSNASSSLNTAGARIRVTCQGKSDVSDTNFNIGAVGPKPSGTICDKQVHLTWNSVQNADYYKIYRLDSGRMRVLGTSSAPYYTMRGLQNGEDYWVSIAVVYNSGAEGQRSDGTKFTPSTGVNPVVFTKQPANGRGCINSSLTLSASVTGSSTIYTEWQLSTDDGSSWNDLIVGNTNLVIPQLALNQHGHRYRMKATNQCKDTVYSNAALIQVDSVIKFQIPPGDVVLCVGQDTTLKVDYKASVKPVFNWLYSKTKTSGRFRVGTSENLLLSNVNESQEGFYTVEMINSCGVSKSADHFAVIVRPELSLNYVGKDSACVGEELTMRLKASGGDSTRYKYWWANAGDTFQKQEITTIPDGEEQWIGRVFDECSADTVDVSVKLHPRDSLKVSLNANTTICLGQSLEIKALANGGLKDGYVYIWNDIGSSSETRTVRPKVTTTYGLYVLDGCSADTAFAQMILSVREPLDLVLRPNVDTACHRQEVTVTAEMNGGRAETYRLVWSDGESSTLRKFSPGQDTLLIATLSDGCTKVSASDSLFLPVLKPLKAEIIGPDTACFNERVTYLASMDGGQSSGYTFFWNGVEGTDSFSSGSDASFNINLVVKDGCTPEDAVAATKTFVRDQLIGTPFNPELTICLGQDTIIGVSPSGGNNPQIGVMWMDDVSTDMIRRVRPSDTTIYSFVLSDNCSDPKFEGKIVVNVRPALSIDLGMDRVKCAEDEMRIPLSGEGGLSSQYVFKVDGLLVPRNELVFSDSITESVMVVLEDNCTTNPASDDITVHVTPLDHTSFRWQRTDYKSIEVLTTTGLNSTRIIWGDGAETINPADLDKHTYLAFGSYGVCKTETDSIGCFRRFCDTVDLYDPSLTDGVAAIVYPNPFNGDHVIVETDRLVKSYHIKMMDAAGKVVFEKEGENRSDFQYMIPAQGLASGMYVIIARFNNDTFWFKVRRN